MMFILQILLLSAFLSLHHFVLITNGAKLCNDSNLLSFAPVFREKDLETSISTYTRTTVTLDCSNDAVPCADVKWFKNNQPFDKTMREEETKFKLRKSKLVLSDVYTEDSGNYLCQVSNKKGTIKRLFELIVDEDHHMPPIIKSQTHEIFKKENDNVTFHCATESISESVTFWYKVVNDSVKNEIPGKENDTEYLILANVTMKDSGLYICSTENDLGSTEIAFNLTVIPVNAYQHDIREVVKHLMRQPELMIFLAILLVIVLIMVTLLLRVRLTGRKSFEKSSSEYIIRRKITLEETSDDNDSLKAPKVNIEGPPMDFSISFEKYMNIVVRYEMEVDSFWEIDRERLILGKPLGEGNFGFVLKGELEDGDKVRPVAVKMLKDGYSDEDVKEFVSEMEVMKRIGKHLNIINLIGCCTQNGPLYVIVEYAANGNLKDFLRQHRTHYYENSVAMVKSNSPTKKDLLSAALQIAKGMEYLASKRCVHRDLAARNILVAENNVMKIADFGLARNLKSEDYYRKTTQGRLPVKWMAPEALCDQKYSTSSDVWSFGILLWEIWTLGETPYPGIDVNRLYQFIREGKRMSRPEACPEHVYTLMSRCWAFDAMSRPTFADIVIQLDYILYETPDKDYLELKASTIDTPPTSEYEYSDSLRTEDSTFHEYQNQCMLLNFHSPINPLYFLNGPSDETIV